MTTIQRSTFCRICEPVCGLIATVEDGRVVGVRGDPQNPSSQGFCCAKAVAMVEVQDDPDRVLTPLRRHGAPGEFSPVSWHDALSDIAARLDAIIDEHGSEAVAGFIGNPPAFSYSASIWFQGFLDAVGTTLKYGVNGEDAAARTAANAILYGSAGILLKPDLWRSHFGIFIGANPLVSHGSIVSEPRLREAMDGIVARGGRVVVIDPRRTETARRYEHVPVRAGTDTWLLLGMLRVIIDEHLIATSFVNKHTTGLADLVRGVQQIDLQTCVERCGVADDTIRDLARELAARPSGFVYGRTGTCTQRFGTLNNLLQDVLNIVTGNIERPGGWVFGWAPIDFIDFAEKAGLLTYGTRRSRVLGLPEVNGQFPSTALAPDIVTPGEGRIRALVTVGGNPVLSSAAGAQIASALSELDLHFSLDLYVNETNKHADYVLPVTTFFEREDVPLLTLPNMLRPMMIATEAVAEPLGDVRQEWEILDEIARRMGRGGALSSRWLRRLARVGLRLTPRRMIDMLVRTSAVGDRFGLRPSGLSLKKLAREHPHGMLLREDLPIEPLASRLRTPDKRIPLAAPALLEELGRFLQHRDDDSYPLRLIGMRELRSQNTWMHNVERLVPASRRQHALVNPRDAAEVGIADGDVARIVSAHGSAVFRISVTEDMTPSTVAVPHGWGHDAGWHRANAAGGANSNDLASSAISDIERLAGMSILNGIPVRLLPAGHEGASGIDSDRAR